jgi:hypothetical protein
LPFAFANAAIRRTASTVSLVPRYEDRHDVANRYPLRASRPSAGAFMQSVSTAAAQTIQLPSFICLP